HSPTAWRQRRYAQSVARHMQRRFGQDIFAAPTIPVSAGAGTAGVTGTSQPVVRVHGFGLMQTPSS
ncbi:hypothetical protein, partial [Stenotrophomonas sp. A3_2]|uniref:hypothetical protein n=1 Tax=Stenotrophomonas sp. A3_2 TaxID=3119978 RepID=UPI002FC2C1FE